MQDGKFPGMPGNGAFAASRRAEKNIPPPVFYNARTMNDKNVACEIILPHNKPVKDGAEKPVKQP